jgi:hypothetical protein
MEIFLNVRRASPPTQHRSTLSRKISSLIIPRPPSISEHSGKIFNFLRTQGQEREGRKRGEGEGERKRGERELFLIS